MREVILAQPKGKVWIVATGALTNIALLFATFPDLIDWIKGLSIMGGAIGEGFTDAIKTGQRLGNKTEWAEFNIFVSQATMQV